MRKIILLLAAAVIAAAADKASFQDFAGQVDRAQPESAKLLSYSRVLKEARQNVVNISTQKSVKTPQFRGASPFDDPFFRQFFDDRRFNVPKERIERSLGSGVIISADGYIVTNNHVVEGASKVLVTLSSGKEDYEAKVIGSDPKSDLAVIKIDIKERLHPAIFFDSDNVEVGDVVFAIGNPFGVGETITSGIVSATNRSAVGIVEYEDFIQTDAAINPGNSGGALINSAGALIGVNSAILTRSGASHGVGFSIPANMVKRIATQLIESGSVSRAWLGVAIGDLKEDLQEFYGRKDGAVIMGVESKSPAEKAGLKRGDLVIKIDNKTIENANSLRNTIGSYPPDKRVSIVIIRDKKAITLTAALGSADKSAIAAGATEYKGLSVLPLTEDVRSQLRLPGDIRGVYVSGVKDSSDAEKAGFLEGDLIMQIENLEIGSIDDFKKATQSGKRVRFYLLRRGATFVTAL